MNKSEFINMVADKTELTKKDTEKVLDAITESIGELLAQADKLQLVGFGTFETKVRAERTGRNPKTGETVMIAQATVPVFKPGKQLKERVNGVDVCD